MNCTGKRCIMQHDKVDPATCECVKYCPEATPPKTNAERIRAMSDEELAIELMEWFVAFSTVEWTTEKLIDWLKEEVSE